jgi:hypothetical protein
MLGVFGCVPAFDTNFQNDFHVSPFNANTLRSVGRFYQENADAIERHRRATLDFDTGSETHRVYSRAKVIDANFFIEGRR